MILYKPIKAIFRNRLEAKLALGHRKYNRLIKTTPEDFILTNNKNSLANYEYFYTNPLEPNSSNYQK